MKPDPISTLDDFMTGGGEMGELIRSIDWSCTPVGAVETWPQSLRTAISIMLNTHFPMYIAWGDDFTQFYNDGYRPILGSTKHPAAMGLSTKVTFAEIWDIIGPMFEGVMRGKAVGFTDFMLPLDRHGFTEECYFIFSYSPIKQEDGLTGGVLVTVTETTDRVLSERRLKTLHDLGEHSANSKTLRDAGERILEVLSLNKHDIPFSILYQYNTETQQYHVAGTTGIDSHQAWLPDASAILRLIREGQTQFKVSGIFNTVSFDKTLPWPETVDACCVSMLTRSDQKSPFGFVVFGISPRLQFNARYGNFFKLLTDQCVTVLSNANAFEEERKRAEALAEIDKAKTVFFSNISHEFRTPLTLMLGPIEDVINDQFNKYPPESKELFSLVHRNGLRLQKLVNNLLDFSRIEAGRIHALYQPIDLSKLTAELASNFRSAIEKACLTLTVNCPPLPEKIFVDPEMWEKIVLNLLSNAFKHTFEGGITVATQWVKNAAQVIVKDTGIGIPSNQLPHLFERFHRVPNVKSRTHEGSGIGLALVNELVKLHGAEVRVESEVEKGTTFIISIPAGKDHLPQDRVKDDVKEISSPGVDRRSFVEEAMRWLPVEENGNAEHLRDDSHLISGHEIWPGTEFKNGRKPVIVLADDNADMRDYVKNILSPYCDVRIVANGKAALDITRKIRPDLVLSDVMMPELDGFELVKALRKDQDVSVTPVILLSARAGEESKVEGLSAGADDYLIKPFSSRELIARVTANLQLSNARKQTQQALKESEGRLRAIVEATPECIKIVAPDGSLQFMNKAGLCMVEAPDAKTVEGACIFDVIADDHRIQWIEKHNRVCQGESLNWEFDIIGLTGTRRSMETHAVPLPNGDGTFSQLAVTRDVSARKRAERLLKRNEIILTGQKQALEQAVHGADLKEVLEGLVETVEQQSERKLFASILLIDKEGKHLCHGAAPNLPPPYNDAIDGIAIGPAAGSCGTAAYLGKEVIVSDIQNNDLWNGFKHLAQEAGLKACWSTPIVSSRNKLLATFAVYYPEVCEPGADDREAVELLSRTAGIVIEWYQEISERHLVEEALRKSEARLRALVTATSDVIYRMSADWTEMWRLEGRSFLEDTGEPITNWQEKYIHPKDRPRVLQAINHAIKTKSVFQLEHEVIQADGTLGWTFSRAIPILDNEGNITEWYGVASDVTERKRYEVTLAESEAKFRQFYDSGMLPIAFWSVNGKVYECNDTFAALVGCSKSDILAGNFDWMQSTAPEYRHLHEKYVAIAVEGKVFVDPYEVELIRPDGSRVNVMVGYTMLEGSNENGVAFLMDVTVQKSLMTQLETRVAERTRELNDTNQALQQSNDDLLQFAHVASHDLKEPVRKMKTFANRLKDEASESLNEKARNFLEKVLSSADRMSNMIEGVLAYSTINASKNIIELVDLHSVMTDIKNDLEVLIHQKNAVISHDHLPAVEGSRFLLYQLFFNLINNALKFSRPETTPHISITSTLVSVNKHQCAEMIISDNGIGFDPKHSEHIFTTFARLNPKDKYEGTGLGLALCKKIVQRHNGTIEAAGEKGVGASFTVRLPFKQIDNK